MPNNSKQKTNEKSAFDKVRYILTYLKPHESQEYGRQAAKYPLGIIVKCRIVDFLQNNLDNLILK